MNKHVNFNDSDYFTKKLEHTSNITNNITGHSHNNYEHNVIKNSQKHIKHITFYDTEINYYKKPLNINKYCDLYHGMFKFKKKRNTSLSQQADITNNTI